MPVTIDWDNDEKTVFRLTLKDGWTWDELFIVNPVGVTMVSSVAQTVHLLVDYTQTRHIALGGGPTRTIDLMKSYPPNFGLAVIVTQNVAPRRALNTVSFLAGHRLGRKVHGVATFEEAYRLFANYENRDD